MFIGVFQHLKWLNAYAIINEVAIQKILKKFKKVFFEVPDNVMDKKIEQFLDSKMFTGRVNKRDALNLTLAELKNFFAENFTQGNRSKAGQVLQ